MKRLLKAWVFLSAFTAAGVLTWLAWPLPDAVGNPPLPEALEIRDRHGLHLRSARNEDGSRGAWSGVDDVQPVLIHAFLAAEDRRFFDHRGVDPLALARAVRSNVTRGRVVSGASTITMQTARLLRPMSRTYRGKLAQMMWALRLEMHRDKDWILEQYMNRIPLGEGAVGVGAAARLYFGVEPSELSLGQAALLAGLARRPSGDNPIASRERARSARSVVLERMVSGGFTDRAAAERAEREPALGAPGVVSFHAPHFTTWVLSRAVLPRAVWSRTGPSGEASSSEASSSEASFSPAQAVRPLGPLHTTLDLELQEALEAEVRHTVEQLRDREVHHGAVVVLDNASGDILAWVGSPDFWGEGDGQVDMVRSKRQPGSTLKPFLYGLALDQGYTGASVLPDVPITFATAAGPYSPQNYDRRFRGPVRLRVALASSLNVPAVELGRRVGTGSFLRVLQDAGFESLDRDAGVYGLGLALGNGEVTLLELANAYRGLVAGGLWRPVRWRLGGDGVASGLGGSQPRFMSQEAAPVTGQLERRFMTREAATLVLDMLSDPAARLEGFGGSTPLEFPFRAAAKTGTSRHFTDNWAVAAAQGFTVAVWVGNFSGQPMRGVSGVTGAGPLLSRAVYETAKRYDAGTLPVPSDVGASEVTVCRLSGLLPDNECRTTDEWFLPGTAPRVRDDWEVDGELALPAEYGDWVASVEGAGGMVFGVQALGRQGAADGMADGEPAGGAPPSEGRLAAVLSAQGVEPEYRILSPGDGDGYRIPVGVEAAYATVPLLATAADGLRWFVDGQPLAAPRWEVQSGRHVILARWPSGHADSVTVWGQERSGADPRGTP